MCDSEGGESSCIFNLLLFNSWSAVHITSAELFTAPLFIVLVHTSLCEHFMEERREMVFFPPFCEVISQRSHKWKPVCLFMVLLANQLCQNSTNYFCETDRSVNFPLRRCWLHAKTMHNQCSLIWKFLLFDSFKWISHDQLKTEY